MKAETEMAMKLLEKDVHEKQDTIISLRGQLEDIKDINLEMYTKLQVLVVLSVIIDIFKFDWGFNIHVIFRYVRLIEMLYFRNVKLK